jgi:hypothetical protein
MEQRQIRFLTASFIFTVATIYNSYSQCYNCGVKGIKTDPSNSFINSINNEKSTKRNTFFDWTNLGLFPVNSQFWPAPYNNIESPFNQDGNTPLIHFLDNPDRMSKDGWELIKYDLGFNENGTPKGTTTRNIYVVLYNKFTGVLRVFVAVNEIVAFNGVQISIRFAEGVQSNLLSNAAKIFALDKFERTDTIKSVAEYRPSKWAYADFNVTYDPCTCNSNSKITIGVKYIVNSTVSFNGSLQGTVTTIENGSQQVNEDGYSITDLLGAGKEAKKTYDDISKFTNEQLRALQIEGKTDIQLTIEQLFKKNSLNQFQQAIKKSSFLSEGLKAVPYLGAAMSIVDFFVGGGNDGPQEVKIMPMALQANVRLSGNINTGYPFPDISFYTPGSKDASCGNDTQYPYFNEVLGTFNLLTTPKINYSVFYSYPITITSASMPEDIEYVLNPAAGFDPLKTEIMGNIIFRNADKSIRIETGYYPINALRQILFLADPFNPELRLLVKLVRQNATSNTQSILFSATYPMTPVECSTCISGNYVSMYNVNNNVEIIDTKSNYVISVPPQNTIAIKSGGSILPTSSLTVSGNFYNNYSSYLPQVSSSRINDFCNSSIYLNSSRNLRVATEPIDQSKGQTQIETALSVFPNPTTGKVSFHYYVEEPSQVRLNLISTTGTVVATPVDAYQEAGSYEFAYDASNLPAGVYISTLETNKGKETKRLVVIK